MLDVRTVGPEGAAGASATVVVIDVFRAFTVSAYALAAGAVECVLVREVEEARRLAARTPGSLISAEVGGLPVHGIPISNSPTMVSALDLGGRVLIQRSSAGTQAVAAATGAVSVLAASLVVASATARRVREIAAPVTLVVSGRSDEGLHQEDLVCAALLEELIRWGTADPAPARAKIVSSARYRRLSTRETPGFPHSDLGLALEIDRFDFAMEVTRQDGLLRLGAVRAGA